MQNLVLENNTQELSLDEMVQIEAGDDPYCSLIYQSILVAFAAGSTSRFVKSTALYINECLMN